MTHIVKQQIIKHNNKTFIKGINELTLDDALYLINNSAKMILSNWINREAIMTSIDKSNAIVFVKSQIDQNKNVRAMINKIGDYFYLVFYNNCMEDK